MMVNWCLNYHTLEGKTMTPVQKTSPQPAPSELKDFEAGDRVWWNGVPSRQFATVIRVEDDALVITHEFHPEEEDRITNDGTGEKWYDSTISQWRVFPDSKRLKPGSVISTTDYVWTNDKDGKARFYFEVTEVVTTPDGRDRQVHLQQKDFPENKTILTGDNFSRILDDMLYLWDLEQY
jgi:hypothetical protein